MIARWTRDRAGPASDRCAPCPTGSAGRRPDRDTGARGGPAGSAPVDSLNSQIHSLTFRWGRRPDSGDTGARGGPLLRPCSARPPSIHSITVFTHQLSPPDSVQLGGYETTPPTSRPLAHPPAGPHRPYPRPAAVQNQVFEHGPDGPARGGSLRSPPVGPRVDSRRQPARPSEVLREQRSTALLGGGGRRP
jgi:hypothetical protein